MYEYQVLCEYQTLETGSNDLILIRRAISAWLV